MKQFANITGRSYQLFEYYGAADADRLIIIMGSGGETAEETAAFLNAKGEKTGVIMVRLYRPFSVEHLLKAIPATVKSIAVLDRTKEPGASGEPLYQDILSALVEGMQSGTINSMPNIIGGRYGLIFQRIYACHGESRV